MPEKTDYRADIDGLRALAVTLVIVFHAWPAALSGEFVGVDVFFVISGYLITGIISSEIETGRFTIVSFYERRVRRILPALIVVLSITSFLAWRLLASEPFLNFAMSAVAAIFFSSNVYFWNESGYFAPEAGQTPLLHTWSLGIEEQFYILFPIALVIALRVFRKTNAVLLLAATVSLSFALSVLWGSRHPSANFFLAPTRAWELLLGAILALSSEHLERYKGGRLTCSTIGACGLGLILTSASAFSKSTTFPGFAALAPTLGTLLVIGSGRKGSYVRSLLSFKPLVALGLISYSLYLWHQPLFAFARVSSLTHPGPLDYVMLSVLSLGLAAITWRFVELRPATDRYCRGEPCSREPRPPPQLSLSFYSFASTWAGLPFRAWPINSARPLPSSFPASSTPMA